MALGMFIIHAVPVVVRGKNIIILPKRAAKNVIIAMVPDIFVARNVARKDISNVSIAEGTVHHSVQYAMVMV